MKHCIVTPDIIGPVKNGGIGTACFELAKYLKKAGDTVAVLYTGPIEIGTLDTWVRYFKKISIDFKYINPSLYPDKPINNGNWFIERSLRVHYWLSNQSFDQIHFQEWQANGFIPIQAKRTGQAYLNTILTTTVHSCEEWIHEGNLRLPTGGVEYIIQKHCEKYSAEKADITIFPSRYMKDWSEGKGWNCNNAEIIPNHFESANKSELSNKTKKITEFVFFGRLETRKGLSLFLNALELLIKKDQGIDLPKITFIGKNGLVGNRLASEVINDYICSHGLQANIIDNYDSESALKYLEEKGRCAIIPTLQDNLPYVVIECVERGIPVIASNIGGVPEIIGSHEHLFAPNAKELSEKLISILKDGLSLPRKKYSSQEAVNCWNLIREQKVRDNIIGQWKPADVTICIAYYNYGNYLPALLESLEKQSVSGFSIVVANDGSTDEFSNIVFNELINKYKKYTNWYFFNKENGGIGETRNFAASYAKTELIVFMDADNEAEPKMIEKMISGINASGSDCLTCHMTGFSEDDVGGKKVVYSYVPTGGPLSAGIFTNCLGDANFIIKTEVFKKLSGFNIDRTTSYEDWEFLLHLLLEGFSLDTIPEKLFLYRHTEAGFSRNTSVALNHLRIINRLNKYLPEYAFSAIKDLYTAINPGSNGGANISHINPKEYQKTRNILQRLLHVLSGGFDAKNYSSLNNRSLNSPGVVNWCKFVKSHYIIFNLKDN
jgi:glycosyltransferase involved in cell wall biosynthesis